MEKGQNKFQEILQNSEVPVLVDFYADWCGPCKIMTPVLKELAGKMKDKVKILKVDVDKNPAAAGAFRIQGVPTLILYKDGKQVWRQAGVVGQAQLEQLIASHN